MSRDYITHWIIGVLCALIWFWGDRVGIPPGAIALAASVVPAALADAMRKSSDEVVNTIPDAVTLTQEVPKVTTQIGVINK